MKDDVSLRRNLRLMPLYAALGDMLPIAPVLVAWYMAHGLSASSVFTLQALFAVAMLFFEVPSGFVADALGRRVALLLGAAFWPLGLLLYRVADSFSAFAIAEIVIAVGVSLQSGCLSALLFDTLGALAREGEYQRREGRLAAAARFGTLLGSLLGGLLAARRLSLPFDLNILIMLMLLPVAFLLREPKRERPRLGKAWSEILAVSRKCLGHGPQRPWILAAGLLTAVGKTALWASFLVCLDLGLNYAWNGLLFALLQLAGLLGGGVSAALKERLGTRAFRALLASPGLLLLGVTVVRHPAALIAFPLVTFLWNLGLPHFFDGLNRVTESRVRASVLSVANLVGNLCFVLLAPLFGLLVDQVSLPAAFAVFGVLAFLGLGAVLATLPETGTSQYS